MLRFFARGKPKGQPQCDATLPEIRDSCDSGDAEEDDGVVFYDCISTPRHLDPAPPPQRQFPLTLAKNHHFVSLEDFAKWKKTSPERLRNTYSEPPACQFQVRGPEYLKQGGKNQKHLKVASQESAYEVIGVNLFRCPTRLENVSVNVQPLREFFDAHKQPAADGVFPKYIVINWIVAPLFGTENHVCSHVFQLKEHAVAGKPHLRSAFERFRQASDSDKNGQFKWMGKIVEGPRTLMATTTALGAERPVLICNQLTTTYLVRDNYLEITNDVSSSRIAAANCGAILRNLGAVVVDMAWLLEGQRTQDLPENILCSIRWVWNTMDELVIPLNEHGELLVKENKGGA